LPPVFDLPGEEDEMVGLTKVLMQSVFVVALIALIGFGATTVAAEGQRLWSIVIHFQYQDGFEFDYVLQRGVPTTEIGAALAECGRSHRTGSVVRYHCYSVQE
jgi:hypothetical protein